MTWDTSTPRALLDPSRSPSAFRASSRELPGRHYPSNDFYSGRLPPREVTCERAPT